MRKVVIEYTGEANDRLLSSIVDRLSTDELMISTELRRRLINVTIELINNIISHSTNKKIISFEVTKEGDDVQIIALNLSSTDNFDSACMRLRSVMDSEDLKGLTDRSILDSDGDGAAHLGIIKIYKNTRGNLAITKMEKDRSLIFKSNCILHEEN
jgi:hypothetical protein